MLEKVLACPNLPTLPAVAVDLLKLTRDPEVDLADIGRLVEKDVALSGKILRTVNSSYYGLSQPCPTINRALAYLGLNTVKSLVLGFSLVDLSRQCKDGFDLINYWRRGLFSAAAARRIAQVTDSCDPDETFLAALMQDIGMLAMHTALGKQYQQVVAQAGGDHAQLPRHETVCLGFSHPEAGARLGERWRLPKNLVNPIRLHHRSAAAAGDPMVATVVLGFQISNLVTSSQPQSALQIVDRIAKNVFDLNAGERRALIFSTLEDARELCGLLEVEVGEFPDAAAILAEADDALIKHQFDVRREAEQLRQTRDALARQALTDDLTGIGNRKKFDSELGARFDQAKTWKGCLGLIIADADKFKMLNDTFGHQAGDEVLREIARRLAQTTGNEGIVCRYGGEEFAVILPGATRTDAARIAERLRKAIEGQPFRLTDAAAESVPVTASFGVAALEPAVSMTLPRRQLLIQLADNSLYAAKRAGRNCVRVFNPKVTAA